ncbi:hypothetical protein BT69DRAFT_1291235 [Atractiella rhizophila]|nr:hypothetical protein BT69DRAFT_1291235 [Atractiella rhizophila]
MSISTTVTREGYPSFKAIEWLTQVGVINGGKEMRQRVKNVSWIFEKDSEELTEEGTSTRGKVASIVLGKTLASFPSLRGLWISWHAADIMDFHLPLIFSFDDGEGRKMDNLGRIGLVDLERISKVAPNLQILTVHYLRSSPSNPPVGCLAPLTHLALYECKLRPSDLSSLFLSVAASLRCLALIHLSSDGYSASHLPMALEPLCPRLETLCWKASWDDDCFVGFLGPLLGQMKSLKALVDLGGNVLDERDALEDLPDTLETLALRMGNNEQWKAEVVLKAVEGQSGEREKKALRRLRRLRLFGHGWGFVEGLELLNALTSSNANVTTQMSDGDTFFLMESELQRFICCDSSTIDPTIPLCQIQTHFFKKDGRHRTDGRLSKWVYRKVSFLITGVLAWDDTV